MKSPRRIASFGFLITLTLTLAGCSGATSPVDSSADATTGGGGVAPAVETRLSPLLPVDASGRLSREDRPGTADDRVDAEIEIFSGGFPAVGIDAADGFADEGVLLSARRAGVEVYVVPMTFSEDRRVNGTGDVTWELTVRGASIPDLRAGDVVRVEVNGNALLEGTLALR